jgi:flagellar biosynthetic protein FliO
MAPGFWANYFERLAIVALVLAALYIIGRTLRTSRFFARSRDLSVVESRMLSPHAALHIVRVGRRYFLIGSGSNGVTRLADLGASFETRAPGDDTGG